MVERQLSRGSKLLRWSAVLILLFSLLTILLKIVLPNRIENTLTTLVRKQCSTCTLELEKVEFSLTQQKVRILNPTFTYKDSEGLRLKANLTSLSIQFSVVSLLRETKQVTQIWLNEPKVVIVEEDRPQRKKPKKEHQLNETQKQPKFQIVLGGIQLKNGLFRYEKKFKDKNATLTITKIFSEIERFGTTPALLIRPIHAHLTGQIEKSGKLELTVETAPFTNRDEAYIDLNVKEVNLSEVNSYFLNAEGVALKGSLISGHALTRVKGNRLSGKVDVIYEGLYLHFLEKQDRTPIEAFFSNVGKDLKLRSDNSHEPPSQHQAPIDKTREHDESIISFILKGIGDAAIKVATS